MSRRRRPVKREVLPDPKYNSKVLSKFINTIMEDGKKAVAEGICYGAFDIIREKTGEDPLKVFKTAMDNIKPAVEVKSRRVGGATYQVPMEIRPQRRMALTFRWLRDYSRKRGERTMRERLAAELMDAHKNTGSCVKKREDTHRMAEANRAFAHFRF